MDPEQVTQKGVLGPVETERLILRPQEPSDAAVFHQLWTERDPRVPPHRRISNGRPRVTDIAADITRADSGAGGPRLLTVVLRSTGAVQGYCGLNGHGNGSSAEPELAYELLRTAHSARARVRDRGGRRDPHVGHEGRLPTLVGRRLGLEPRLPTSPGQARLPGAAPDRAVLRSWPQPSHRARPLVLPVSAQADRSAGTSSVCVGHPECAEEVS